MTQSFTLNFIKKLFKLEIYSKNGFCLYSILEKNAQEKTLEIFCANSQKC